MIPTSSLNLDELTGLKWQTQNNWGPNHNFILNQYANIPFVPFNRFKADKLKKVYDFVEKISKQNYFNRNAIVQVNDEETEFHQVEMKTQFRPPKKFGMGSRNYYNRTQQQQKLVVPQEEAVVLAGKKQNMQKKKKQQQRQANFKQRQIQVKFKEQGLVREEWLYLGEINKSMIEKIRVPKVTLKPLITVGQVYQFRQELNNSLLLKDYRLVQDPKIKIVPQLITQETIFQELFEKEAEANKNIPQVYIVDSLMTAIMSAKQSQFPWNMKVTKMNNNLIVDQFEDATQSYLDLQTTNENSLSLLPENEDQTYNLCHESTLLSKYFQKQSVDTQKRFKFSENPEMTQAHKYVKCIMMTEDPKMPEIHINVRVNIDAFQLKDDKTEEFMMVRALNQQENNNEWLTDFKIKRGALTQKIYDNNISLLTRWVCQMRVAEIDLIKICYATKFGIVEDKKSQKYNVICIDTLKQRDLIQKLQLKINDCWQTLSCYLLQLLGQEDGKYALLKQPYKSDTKLYRISK